MKEKTNGQGWKGHRVHVMQRHWARTMNTLSLRWVHTVQCPLTDSSTQSRGSQSVHTVQYTVTDSNTQSRGSQSVHTVQYMVTDNNTQSRGSQPVHTVQYTVTATPRAEGVSQLKKKLDWASQGNGSFPCCNITLKSPASVDQLSGPGGN